MLLSTGVNERMSFLFKYPPIVEMEMFELALSSRYDCEKT